MITFLTFCRAFCIGITFYSHWAMSVVITAYFKEDKSEFYFYLVCISYGALVGITFMSILDVWWGLPEFDPSIDDSLEISNFLSEEQIQILNNDLKIKKVNEFGFESQEELDEDLRRQATVWVITTLLVYFIVFSIKQSTA